MKTSLFIIAVLMLILGSLWLKSVSLSADSVNYTILFSKIGGLKCGDPVSINGVEKGTVSKISLHNADVAVQICVDKDIQFTDSSSISLETIGLMGERTVAITLSPLGDLHIPDSDSSINYIKGEYQTSLAETVGMVSKIILRSDTVLTSMDKIINKIKAGQITENDSNRVEIAISINEVTYRAEATNEDLRKALDTAMVQISQQVKRKQ